MAKESKNKTMIHWKDGALINATPAEKKKIAATEAYLQDTIVRGILDTVMACGEHLYEEYFDRDHAAYTDKAHNKSSSFQALLSSPNLSAIGVSGTALRNYVNVYIQAAPKSKGGLGLIPRGASGLGLTQRIRLLPLNSEGDTVSTLAQSSIDEGWNLRELQGQIDDAKADLDSGDDSTPARKKNPLRFIAKAEDDLRAVQANAWYFDGKSPYQKDKVIMELQELRSAVQTMIDMFNAMKSDDNAHKDTRYRLRTKED